MPHRSHSNVARRALHLEVGRSRGRLLSRGLSNGTRQRRPCGCPPPNLLAALRPWHQTSLGRGGTAYCSAPLREVPTAPCFALRYALVLLRLTPEPNSPTKPVPLTAGRVGRWRADVPSPIQFPVGCRPAVHNTERGPRCSTPANRDHRPTGRERSDPQGGSEIWRTTASPTWEHRMHACE